MNYKHQNKRKKGRKIKKKNIDSHYIISDSLKISQFIFGQI